VSEIFPTNVSNETWLQFVREAAATRREIEEATGRHRAVMKRAKAAGCNPKVIAAAITAKKQDPAVIVSEVRDSVRVLNLVGIELDSGSIFGSWQPEITQKAAEEFDLHVAEERGYGAGKGGGDRDANPYEPGSPFHAAYDKGWIAGQRAIAEQMGPDKKPVAASRARPARTEAGKDAPAAATKRPRGRPRKDGQPAGSTPATH
jgi:hypothetical protein